MLNVRRQEDAVYRSVVNLPNAGANVFTPSFNLGRLPILAGETADLVISIPALPLLADAHTVTVTVQDSLDNITFADVDQLDFAVVTGGGGVGSAAFSERYRLPTTIRQYIRGNIVAQAAGGNSSALLAEIKLKF